MVGVLTLVMEEWMKDYTDFDDSLDIMLTPEFATSCTTISYGKQVSNHNKGSAVTTGIFHDAVCTKLTNIFLLPE